MSPRRLVRDRGGVVCRDYDADPIEPAHCPCGREVLVRESERAWWLARHTSYVHRHRLPTITNARP